MPDHSQDTAPETTGKFWHSPITHRWLASAGVLALGVFAALGALSLLRWQRHPEAVADDLRHPVRHAFVAAVPASVLLLATVATTLAGPSRLALAVWMLGAVAHFGVTVWVMARWLQGNREGGMAWAGITPVLFIPIVGNVLSPLAGVALGQPEWAAAQFGVGMLLWPVLQGAASAGLTPPAAVPRWARSRPPKHPPRRWPN